MSDVTLVSDDQQMIQVHKVILTSCSDFFKNILTKNTEGNLVIYLNDVSGSNLNKVLDYIYCGEVKVYQEELESFLAIAQRLRLDGLLSETSESPLNERKENVKQTTNMYPHHPAPDVVTAIATLNSETVSMDEIEQKVKDFMNIEADRVTCKVCGKIANGRNRRQDIKAHIERHMKGISYTCNLCNKSCPTRNDLRTHKVRTCTFRLQQQQEIDFSYNNVQKVIDSSKLLAMS